MSTDKDTILAIFRHLDIFSDLDTQALQELSNLCAEKRHPEGEIIFKEDSIGDSMMLIVSGEVRVSQTPDPETEEALIILKAGDLFGEMAVLEDLPRTATAIAHTDTVILEISREYFLKFIESDHQSGVKILLKLARILSSRLRETDNKLRAFTSMTRWI